MASRRKGDGAGCWTGTKQQWSFFLSCLRSLHPNFEFEVITGQRLVALDLELILRPNPRDHHKNNQNARRANPKKAKKGQKTKTTQKPDKNYTRKHTKLKIHKKHKKRFPSRQKPHLCKFTKTQKHKKQKINKKQKTAQNHANSDKTAFDQNAPENKHNTNKKYTKNVPVKKRTASRRNGKRGR